MNTQAAGAHGDGVTVVFLREDDGALHNQNNGNTFGDGTIFAEQAHSSGSSFSQQSMQTTGSTVGANLGSTVGTNLGASYGSSVQANTGYASSYSYDQ